MGWLGRDDCKGYLYSLLVSCTDDLPSLVTE